MGQLVYSTDQGKLCPGCQQPIKQCQCRQQAAKAINGDGIVRITRETKGRKGKGVSIVTGLGIEPDALKKLAKTLKQHCGTGGAIKNGNIEIQGDQREVIKAFLIKQGFQVKLSGG